MTASTAVAFVLCARAMLLLEFDYRKTGACVVGLCVAICGVTGMQYITGRDFGIDRPLILRCFCTDQGNATLRAPLLFSAG